MNKQTKFIGAIALQIVIILAIVVFKLSVLTGGTQVVLQITPVDPTSPLRGDYVTFQYAISSISPGYYTGGQATNGQTVYVLLRQSGSYWVVQSVQATPPSDGTTFIKGKVVSGGRDTATSYPQQFDYQQLRISYGVEEYFIPEGKGRNMSFWNKNMAAGVVVDDKGNAVLKQLYIDQKPWP